MLRIECIQDEAKLWPLRSHWDRLANGAMMQGFAWSQCWWKAFDATHSLRVLVAHDGHEVCGIFPLAETKSLWTGQTWEMIGSGKVCSDDLGILCHGSDTQRVVDAFAEWLAEPSGSFRWDHLNLDGIRDDNLLMQRFRQSLVERIGTQVECKESPSCWAASLDGGIEGFKSRLTKRGRKIFREAEAEVASGRSQFEIARSLDHAIELARETRVLHQARWKERGIQGCFSEQNFADFVDNAIRSHWNEMDENAERKADHEETTNQRVVVGLIRIDGTPASGCICFRDRDALNIYLTGMNPVFADLRPGWQLNACCIKYAIETGCRVYDLLRGDEEYKERLGAIPRLQHRWLMAGPRWISQVRNATYRSAIHVRQWIRDYSAT